MHIDVKSLNKLQSIGQGKPSLKQFLQIALLPCGQTLYVWGGGWNEEDTGAGSDAVTLGLNPGWKEFFDKQASSYDFHAHRFAFGCGLDCSGYVGWVLYNLLEQESGKEGYVSKASTMAKDLAERGLGTFIPHEKVDHYAVGDIVSIEGHIFICIGECEDTSIVLLHSSPQAGVQISGTVRNGETLCTDQLPSGEEKSEAWHLADKAMKTCFPACSAVFPTKYCDERYRKGSIMRWDLEGEKVIEDREGLSHLAPLNVLEIILSKT